ncbi:MAG TPA: alpha/beta hydrolase [Gemmatimonadales bacterium]|nr:alpha/beta hydrolase [Gemmatimonadales bacterium]
MGTVVSTDGTRIAFEATGSGPALVVVAGALGYKDFPYLRKLAAEFGKEFRVYSYDRRGRGDSTDTQPFNVQKEIEDLAAVCREAGNPIVVGISSGAALALEAAAAGVPMSRLVAFEPPYMVGDHRRPDHARFEAELTALISRGDRDGALKLFMRTVGVPGFLLAIMRIMPFWKALRRVAHTLPYDAAAMNGFQIPEARLARIRVPTLLAGGGKSPGSLKAGARAAAAAVPGAQFIEIPKQSHMIKAAALARAVREHNFTATG